MLHGLGTSTTRENLSSGFPTRSDTNRAVQLQQMHIRLKSSRKHLRTKVTPDLYLTYSKNEGNLGLVLDDKKLKFLHKIICYGDLLESPRGI